MSQSIYEVWREADGQRHFVAAAYTEAEAAIEMQQFMTRVEAVGGRNDRYWIEEKAVTTSFVIPARPTPREIYTAKVEPGLEDGEPETKVTVLRSGAPIASYGRNYAMLGTFEPFRQGGRDYALISPNYTGTSVMDLQTGEVVAAEPPDSFGFCPVGFYVPDWWEANDGSIIPGSHYWTEDMEQPSGQFGFVWGCVWGDDSSWKVQYLDLTDITHGLIRRDDRFGYVELATISANPKDFIRIRGDRVAFATFVDFSLNAPAEPESVTL